MRVRIGTLQNLTVKTSARKDSFPHCRWLQTTLRAQTLGDAGGVRPGHLRWVGPARRVQRHVCARHDDARVQQARRLGWHSSAPQVGWLFAESGPVFWVSLIDMLWMCYHERWMIFVVRGVMLRFRMGIYMHIPEVVCIYENKLPAEILSIVSKSLWLTEFLTHRGNITVNRSMQISKQFAGAHRSVHVNNDNELSFQQWMCWLWECLFASTCSLW